MSILFYSFINCDHFNLQILIIKLLSFRNTSRSDFVFNADRLIRLVVEEGLNQLPSVKCEILTPLNQVYHGLRFSKGNCGGKFYLDLLNICSKNIVFTNFLSNFSVHHSFG